MEKWNEREIKSWIKSDSLMPTKMSYSSRQQRVGEKWQTNKSVKIVGSKENNIKYMLSCEYAKLLLFELPTRAHNPCQQWHQVRALWNINSDVNSVKAHCDPISSAFYTHNFCHMPLKRIVAAWIATTRKYILADYYAEQRNERIELLLLLEKHISCSSNSES